MFELCLTILTGLFFSISIYLILSLNLVRCLVGLVVLSNSVNLLIFLCGRVSGIKPPLIPDTDTFLEYIPSITANPLPQALILTAIVISFSLFAFFLTLVYRCYDLLGTDRAGEMRESEPVENNYKSFGW